uniref:Uncharacterized protein n=1 Tax=Arundo donax TaxID=35708 RepID=A0A0A9C642_ARUDO
MPRTSSPRASPRVAPPCRAGIMGRPCHHGRHRLAGQPGSTPPPHAHSLPQQHT